MSTKAEGFLFIGLVLQVFCAADVCWMVLTLCGQSDTTSIKE
jgi:hypothetical protein